jgi:hypothetical protein
MITMITMTPKLINKGYSSRICGLKTVSQAGGAGSLAGQHGGPPGGRGGDAARGPCARCCGDGQVRGRAARVAAARE